MWVTPRARTANKMWCQAQAANPHMCWCTTGDPACLRYVVETHRLWHVPIAIPSLLPAAPLTPRQHRPAYCLCQIYPTANAVSLRRRLASVHASYTATSAGSPRIRSNSLFIFTSNSSISASVMDRCGARTFLKAFNFRFRTFIIELPRCDRRFASSNCAGASHNCAASAGPTVDGA